jgi:hypothetical protein
MLLSLVFFTSNSFSQASRETEFQEINLCTNSIFEMSNEISGIEDYFQNFSSMQKDQLITYESSTNVLNQIDDGPGDGIKYKVCDGVYQLGCKDAQYSNNIKRIQRCLGIKATGYFGKNTQEELKTQTDNIIINDDGIDFLCGDF